LSASEDNEEPDGSNPNAIDEEELQDAVEDLSKAGSSQSIKRIKRRGGNLSQSQDGESKS